MLHFTDLSAVRRFLERARVSVLKAPFACRNTFQVTMASDTDGRSFATLCYDNLVSAVSAVAGFSAGDGTPGFNLYLSSSAVTAPNMTCLGTNGLFNGA